MFLTDVQVAERYGVSRPTVWRWASLGKLPQPVRFSRGCTRWRMDQLEVLEAKMMEEAKVN
ncbi:MAG: AlpA family transcriptional regulator [Pseudomonadota bacterium]|nr:AlpA family transcriptional regulator [Pseudomonadota bacterium]